LNTDPDYSTTTVQSAAIQPKLKNINQRPCNISPKILYLKNPFFYPSRISFRFKK
jgi:hypothetical protein